MSGPIGNFNITSQWGNIQMSKEMSNVSKFAQNESPNQICLVFNVANITHSFSLFLQICWLHIWQLSIPEPASFGIS